MNSIFTEVPVKVQISCNLEPCRSNKLIITSSMHNMFGASVSEVYNIIWCQFDLKIDNLMVTFLLLLLSCVAT